MLNFLKIANYYLKEVDCVMSVFGVILVIGVFIFSLVSGFGKDENGERKRSVPLSLLTAAVCGGTIMLINCVGQF